MRRLDKAISVGRLLAESQVLVAMTVLIVCSLTFFVHELHSAKMTLESNILATGRLLARNLYSTLAFSDSAEAERLLHSLSSDPQFDAAVLEDSNGKVFAQYGHSPGDFIKSEPTFSEVKLSSDWKFLTVSVSVANGSEILGVLRLRATLSLFFRDMIYRCLILMLMLVSGFAIAVVFSRHTSRRLTWPLNTLIERIRSISKSGTYDESVVIISAKRDIRELQQLVDEFNQMIDQIRSRDIAIRSANESLEQKVVERTQALVAAQKSLVQSGRMSALGEMAGGIAHEINNPLAIILGKIGILKLKLAKAGIQNDDLSKTLETVERMSSRIEHIVRGLRSFSRDGSKDPFQEVPVSRIINDVLELCSSRFSNHGVELRIGTISSDLRMECRETQVGQVLLNLFNNAHDAVQKLEEKWVALDIEDGGENLRITVTDSGKGIPEEIRSRIMEPFFTTKPVNKGTGLGLSISKGIIEAHHGVLAIDIEYPNTRFVIHLPKRQIAVKTAA